VSLAHEIRSILPNARTTLFQPRPTTIHGCTGVRMPVRAQQVIDEVMKAKPVPKHFPPRSDFAN
jgi:hypothetical protein